MILLSILTVILSIVAIVALSVAIAFGAGFIAVFGDLIVFALIVWVLVKLFKRGK